MTRLTTDARLPQGGDIPGLVKRLYDLNRDTANQVNALSEGAIRAATNASSAPPITGVYTPGDFVRNSAPAELGTAGAKYVLAGWICVAAPLTFVQQRFLTGN
jgi:hypothetical protein